MNPYASPKPCHPDKDKSAADAPRSGGNRIWSLVVFTTVSVALAQFAWALGLGAWNVATDGAELPAGVAQVTNLVSMLIGGVLGVIFALRVKCRGPADV